MYVYVYMCVSVGGYVCDLWFLFKYSNSVN